MLGILGFRVEGFARCPLSAASVTLMWETNNLPTDTPNIIQDRIGGKQQMPLIYHRIKLRGSHYPYGPSCNQAGPGDWEAVHHA